MKNIQHSQKRARARLQRQAGLVITAIAFAGVTVGGASGDSIDPPEAVRGAAEIPPVPLKIETIFSSPVSANHFTDTVGAFSEEPFSLATEALYSLNGFMSAGVVNWNGYKFTYYSESVLPGTGLSIPGRHVSNTGYVSDQDGYIVLAGSAAMGTVFETPFGFPGKIYDRGTSGTHLDVYIL